MPSKGTGQEHSLGEVTSELRAGSAGFVCAILPWPQLPLPRGAECYFSFCYREDLFHVGVLSPALGRKGSECPFCIYLFFFFLNAFSSK